MSNIRLTAIPFSGFYNSIHDSHINCALESMFSNDNGVVYSGVFENAYASADWRIIHEEYASLFAARFSEEFNLETLKFKDLVSPKYYNYETDRIFCEISLTEVIRLFNLVDKKALRRCIKANFTSGDGFISFYSNDLDKWPADVADWDHNQIFALISVYADQVKRKTFSLSVEYELIEDLYEEVERILNQNIKDVARFYRIAEYLRLRESRH